MIRTSIDTSAHSLCPHLLILQSPSSISSERSGQGRVTDRQKQAVQVRLGEEEPMKRKLEDGDAGDDIPDTVLLFTKEYKYYSLLNVE